MLMYLCCLLKKLKKILEVVFKPKTFIFSNHALEQTHLPQKLTMNQIKESILNSSVTLDYKNHIYFTNNSLRFPCKKINDNYIVKSIITKGMKMIVHE